MTQPLIRQALETALQTFAAANSLPVAWENVELNPKPSTAYLRVFLLPAQTTSDDLERKHRGYRGIFQVSVCVPNGNGPGPGEVIAAGLEAAFPPSTPLAAGAVRVNLTGPMSAAPAIADADERVIPCSVGYLAHTSA